MRVHSSGRMLSANSILNLPGIADQPPGQRGPVRAVAHGQRQEVRIARRAVGGPSSLVTRAEVPSTREASPHTVPWSWSYSTRRRH